MVFRIPLNNLPSRHLYYTCTFQHKSKEKYVPKFKPLCKIYKSIDIFVVPFHIFVLDKPLYLFFYHFLWWYEHVLKDFH